jgi:energy-coupling factor transporter ATP-binding protein EcfA2
LFKPALASTVAAGTSKSIGASNIRRGNEVMENSRLVMDIEAGGARLCDLVHARSGGHPGGDSHSAVPRAPRTIEETGLTEAFLLELVARTAYVLGKVSLSILIRRLKLGARVLEDVLAFGIRERMLERSGGPHDIDREFQLTETGHRAAELMARCRYVGPAPVPLEQYQACLQRQSTHEQRVTRASVEAAFADMAVTTALLDQIGSAVNNGRPVIFFGPSGSGKTSLAERLVRLMPKRVAVPYAIAIENEIIQMFDPLIHKPCELVAADGGSNNTADGRWQYCRPPTGLSGGELTLDMLELCHDAVNGYYQAPPHIKATGGLYIIDDLGRQRVSPAALLDRWIVPLDRGYDMLTLRTGVRFSLPLNVRIVFTSNAAPADLGDEAFFRRLGAKLYVGPLDVTDYRAIYQQRSGELGIRSDDEAFDYLVHELHRLSRRPLLASYPGELLRIVLANARYLEQPAVADGPSLKRAWNIFFAVVEHDIAPAGMVEGGRSA